MLYQETGGYLGKKKKFLHECGLDGKSAWTDLGMFMREIIFVVNVTSTPLLSKLESLPFPEQ